MRYGYAVDLETDESGRVVAMVADVVGCVTDGADRGEALAEAEDALEEALAAAMDAREDIPVPSPARGRPIVAPGAAMAAKVALYLAMRGEGRG
jgi:antitoxin HicB